MTKKTCKEDISPTIYKVRKIAKQDAQKLHEAEQSYGDSWKKRGGVGAFMMLARKWDRLEKQVNEHNFNIFKASAKDKRCLLYTSPSPRDRTRSRMPSSA